jgi:acyl-CoA reductase-like NAD-dependent aldehyde dehydrogenase
MQIIENAIGGKLTISGSDRRSPVFNPATGEQIAELPLSTVEEINAAVANAKAAQPAWGAMPPLKRARFMFKFKELLDRHASDIAREISREHGKTHDDALGEVARGIEVVEFACGIPICSRAISPAMSAPASIPSPTVSHWAWSPASPRSTSRPWCRCGCTRSRSPAGIPSS